MYYDFFGFREAPFSIAPDPRYLYLSDRHKEALAHLMYGVQGQGGFIVVTGEVGTGKTTVCRCFLEQAPESADIALILNPKLSARELLAAICDELKIRVPAGASIKRMIDQLNQHLLSAHAEGRHTVLIIDEAQNLSGDVLEQLRLLTNLETAEKKLLQIVLLGQPELQEILERQELRQLAQRITARYHLEPLNKDEIGAYVRYRFAVAGFQGELFSPRALKTLYRLGQGVPRLINLIGDRALLGAYAQSEHQVSSAMVKAAAREVAGSGAARRTRREPRSPSGGGEYRLLTFAAFLMASVALVLMVYQQLHLSPAALPEAKADIAPTVDSGKVLRKSGKTSAPQTSAPVASKTLPPPPTVTSASNAEPSPAFNLDDYVPTDRNKVLAYQSLLALWGAHYKPSEDPIACDFASRQGLQCEHRQGNWHSLIRMNRPAVLRLFNRQGDAVYGTLFAVDGQQGHLQIDGKTVMLPVSYLQSHWLGDYSLLWHTPPFLNSKSGKENAQAKQAWLKQQLSTLIQHSGLGQNQANQLLQSSTSDQIKWFQRRNGLIPDGIPGTVTLIKMNSELNIQVPKLNQKAPVGAVANG